MKIFPFCALLVAMLSLLACAGGSSPDQAPTTDTGFIPDPTISVPVKTVCDVDSDSYHFCDQVVTSPAPPAYNPAANAQPGANGVTDCEADWLPGGATTDIGITVFIPAFNEGETMPLMLHSHGWGGFRVTEPAAEDPTAASNTFEGLFDMTQRLWKEDYIVISFDQRGWGTSQGNASVIDPCYETVDAMAIIDWAVENLPVTLEAGDPVVGAMGGSYGGAYQMMLAAMDDRVDSIMPVATWNSLAAADNPLAGNPAEIDAESQRLHSSLITNEMVKRGYVNGLCILGQTVERPSGVGATLDPRVVDACAAIQKPATGVSPPGGAVTGTDMDNAVTPAASAQAQTTVAGTELRGLFARNAMANPDLRTGRPAMNVDVFLVQGMRDVVFNGTDAYDNYKFFEANTTGDVRLMTHDAGHMLTTFELAMEQLEQTGQYASLYQKQGMNSCGDIDMFPALLAWFDETLRPNHSSSVSVDIPEFCISLTSDRSRSSAPVAADGRNSDDIPSFLDGSGQIDENLFVGNSVGSFSLGATTVSTDTADADEAADASKIIASPRLFVALTPAMTGGEYIAGIPKFDEVKVQNIVEAGAPALGAELNPTAFVAIGIQKADGSFVEVDEQVTAIRRAEDATSQAITYKNLRLPMVAEGLEQGDVVGLLLYRTHGQFQLLPGTEEAVTQGDAYVISGSIGIPLFDSSNNQIAPAISD